MKKLLAAAAIVLSLCFASPAHACGYWDCQEVEFGWYCEFYPG